MSESLRTIALALLQGLTEFLPVSSSAHLILPAKLLGWPDQGLAFDVAVHLGSLLAVLFYFRADLRHLLTGSVQGARTRRWNADLHLLACLALASLPVALGGLLLASRVEGEWRSLPVIAAATLGFGVLLGLADRRRGSAGVTLKAALLVGLAQVLALVPGASRSGVTITAGLLCGLSRRGAARFSFLLSVPVILAAALFKLAALIEQAGPVSWGQLLLGAAVSGVVAFLTIGWFLRLVERVGLMPFVIYRCALGLALFAIYCFARPLL